MKLYEYIELYNEEMPVGTVKIRGYSKIQLQRDGSWLRIGSTGEPPPKPRKSALALPQKRKRSPAIKQVRIPVGQKWRDSAPDMPESTMDEMFLSKEDEKKAADLAQPDAGAEPQATPPTEPEEEDEEDEDDLDDEDPDDGDYPDKPKPKPQRKAFHDWVFRTFLEHVEETPDDRMPVAVLVLGGPVSGRTSIIKSLTHDALFVRVDPGTIATMVPEYEEAAKKLARNAPSIVQDEATYLAHRLIEETVKKRKSVAIEAVGLNSDDLSQLLADLREVGYYSIVMLVDISRASALEHHKFRGIRTGTWVPRELFALSKAAISTFEQIKHDSDEFHKFDSSGTPKYVSEPLSDLAELFDEDDSKDPSKPAFSFKEIRKRSLEGLEAEKLRLDTIPEHYKPNEGLLLAHYDDAHIMPLDLGEDKDQDRGINK